MKKLLAIVCGILLMAGCAGKSYTFNEGPPRAECHAEKIIANVGQEWNFSCIIAGDITPYTDEMVGIVVSLSNYGELNKFTHTGLGRLHEFSVSLNEEYWRKITGHSKFTAEDQFWGGEIIQPGDPRYPGEPIEGIEASLDGSFNITVEFYQILEYNRFTGEAVVEFLTKGIAHGKLDCPQCTV